MIEYACKSLLLYNCNLMAFINERIPFSHVTLPLLCLFTNRKLQKKIKEPNPGEPRIFLGNLFAFSFSCF